MATISNYENYGLKKEIRGSYAAVTTYAAICAATAIHHDLVLWVKVRESIFNTLGLK